MGIQDRDYYGQGTAPAGGPGIGGSIGAVRWWSVSTWLIAICIGVFLLDALMYRSGLVYVLAMTPADDGTLRDVIVPLARYEQLAAAGHIGGIKAMGPVEAIGYFSFTKAFASLQVWRLITFQFLHASLGHIFGNMLGLYFFGGMIERYLGRWRFLAFYLLCGVAGPIVYLIFALTGILGTSLATPMIGASAGVFGVLIAAAQIAPRTTVMLLFPPIPMQLRTLALVLLAIAAFTVFTQGVNAGGEAAHLGGAALGFLLIRQPQLLSWADPGFFRRFRGSDAPKMTYHGWR